MCRVTIEDVDVKVPLMASPHRPNSVVLGVAASVWMNEHIVDTVVEHHPLLSSLKVCSWDEESEGSGKEGTTWDKVSIEDAHWLGGCWVNWTHRAVALVISKIMFEDESVAKLHGTFGVLLVGTPEEDVHVIGDELRGVVAVGLVMVLGKC